MSFYASNNRIHVVDGAAQVFDTNTPMPHILQTLTVNGVGVNFPASGVAAPHSHWASIESVYENVYANRQKCGFRPWCRNEMDCGYKQECQYTTRNGIFGYYCDQVYRCDQVWTCTDRYECWYEWGYEYEYVNHWRYHCQTSRQVLAMEWEQVIDLGAVVAGINADFVLVNVSGSRTAAGAQHDYGTFVSAVPGTNFMAQGSAILESAFDTGGSSWLRRIMSVYVENGRVKVKFKHSNRHLDSRRINEYVSQLDWQPHGWEGTDNTASSFVFNYTIYIGKFT